MPLSVNWSTYVISVPQSYLTFLSGVQYELNVDQFRKDLKGIEASPDGIHQPDTHRHVTETTISGFTYARLVEMLAPYTVEFEDGQYVVVTTGANHNLADVLVPNQVSLVVQNSAGLINSPDILYASFGGVVLVDPNNTTGLAASGTNHPTGTRRRPVDNFNDAVTIANTFGLNTIEVLGGSAGSPIQIDNVDLRGFIIRGNSPTVAYVEVLSGAQVAGTDWQRLDIRGTFDGPAHILRCVVRDIQMLSGTVHDSRLRGTFTLTGTDLFTVVGCSDDLAGTGAPTIDWAGADVAVIVRDYRGGLNLKGRTNAKDVSIDGILRLVLEPTFGGTGQVVGRGVGPAIDNQNSSPSFTLIDQFVSPHVGAHVAAAYDETAETIDLQVWGERSGLKFTPTAMTVDLYDPAGTLILSVTETDATLSGNVYYVDDEAVTLQPLTSYRAEVSVSDANGTISATRAVVTSA